MKETTKEWNSCADLANDHQFSESDKLYDTLLELNHDPFQYMLQMQFDLQMALAKKLPDRIPMPDSLVTLGQKFDWLREQKQAFDDEYSELIDALPGMNMSARERSALWKRWKSKYNDIRSLTFDDLTDDEIKELKFELVDTFHFYMNMFFAIGMDSRELFSYYVAKNAENHRRSQSGY